MVGEDRLNLRREVGHEFVRAEQADQFEVVHSHVSFRGVAEFYAGCRCEVNSSYGTFSKVAVTCQFVRG